MVTDLLEFITARLDEDEQQARAAGWHRWEAIDDLTTVVALGNGKVVASVGRDYDAQHMARHDPARVLREVEAKRKILARHRHRRFVEPLDINSKFEEDHRPAFDEAPRYVGCEQCSYDSRYEEVYPSWWCEHVRLLALPYADHPDFRPEWAVE